MFPGGTCRFIQYTCKGINGHESQTERMFANSDVQCLQTLRDAISFWRLVDALRSLVRCGRSGVGKSFGLRLALDAIGSAVAHRS